MPAGPGRHNVVTRDETNPKEERTRCERHVSAAAPARSRTASPSRALTEGPAWRAPAKAAGTRTDWSGCPTTRDGFFSWRRRGGRRFAALCRRRTLLAAPASVAASPQVSGISAERHGIGSRARSAESPSGPNIRSGCSGRKSWEPVLEADGSGSGNRTRRGWVRPKGTEESRTALAECQPEEPR